MSDPSFESAFKKGAYQQVLETSLALKCAMTLKFKPAQIKVIREACAECIADVDRCWKEYVDRMNAIG